MVSLSAAGRRQSLDQTEPPVSGDWQRQPTDILLGQLGVSSAGLSQREASERLDRYGPNELAIHRRGAAVRELTGLVLNPLVIILLIASAVSAVLGEPVNAAIIVFIVALNVVLNFAQTHRSQQAIDALRQQVALTALVVRDGHEITIPRRAVVPGDVLRLAAGDVVPADGRLLESRDLYVNEGVLTGESLPVDKDASSPGDWNLSFGTSVMSGGALMLAVVTGPRTAFGSIAEHLAEQEPQTAFEQGLSKFGLLITRLVFFLTLLVFLVNMVLRRDPLESFLFAVALAIGLTPELLPMITSVTLAHGAVRMARKKVVVKRLPAIQNIGSMDVLCSDKTGTLTAGEVVLDRALDPFGAPDKAMLHLAAINSAFETGIKSPLDAAILAETGGITGYDKIDEIPFDFVRRRLSVVVADQSSGQRQMICKGAPESVIAVCSAFRAGDVTRPFTPEAREQIATTFQHLSAAGYRALGVAARDVPVAGAYRREDETDMVFAGFVTFVDPPRPDAGDAIRDLAADGVRVVILTGDNDLVAAEICRRIGLDPGAIVSGTELDQISDSALGALSERTTLFARVSPEQKNRVIRALRGRGHVVGFLGDGVNDAPSLLSADVGISVANATDVAREAADVILLERDLHVLHDGVREGRESFGNVMKYLMMGLSADFGNVISMAIGAIVLPFLPMLPLQVLLNDLLYSTSQITLPVDHVDPDYVRKPKHWDLGFLQHFMLVFGPLSSAFDLLTFFVMLRLFHAGESLFQTGWFVESLATQTLVVYVIRTVGNPLQSRPSRALVFSTLGCLAIGVLLPYSPAASILGFVPPPGDFFGFLGLVVVAYLLLAQAAKHWFYRRFAFSE